MKLHPDTIREMLLEVWGIQSCQTPEDWPPTLAELMVKQGLRRGSWRPYVDHAVALIAEYMVNNDEPLDAVFVHRAFWRFDAEHAAKLCERLRAAVTVK